MDAEAAARWLLEAWESGDPLGTLPPEIAPRDVAAGEEIATALVEALGLPVCGLRLVAAPTPGPDGVVLAGVVLEGRLLPNGAMVAASILRHARMSAAVIGVLGEPLDAEADAAPVFAALHPAIDISSSRFTTAPDSAAVVTADLAGLGHIVVGPRAPVPTGPIAVALAEGRKRPQGVMVDVIAALGVAARAARRLGGLPAGAILVAAGLTPALVPEAGDTHVARMGALGRARVRIG